MKPRLRLFYSAILISYTPLVVKTVFENCNNILLNNTLSRCKQRFQTILYDEWMCWNDEWCYFKWFNIEF